MSSDALDTDAGLNDEIRKLRAGEEDGWTEGAMPTPGQYLKRLHELDEESRIRSLEVLMGAAEGGRQCVMGLHEANLQELRQRTMASWGTLSRISEMCRDADRDGLIHVNEIVDLLPEALRYG